MKARLTQKEFYNSKKEKQSKLNKLWGIIRTKYQGPGTPFREHYINILKNFLGELREKKVLEFGIGPNHPVSFYIAENCKEYTVVDLSKKRLERYEEKLRAHNIRNVKYIVGDIMKVNLPFNQYDVVVGLGVVHHLEDIRKAMYRIRDFLRVEGYTVFADPLNTEPLIMFLRFVSRPLRPNLMWEFPLETKEINIIKSIFPENEIVYMNALSKLAFPFAFLPFSTHTFHRIFDILNSADIKILKYPFFQRFAWQVAIKAIKCNV